MFTPNDIKRVKVSYKCPQCNTWVEKELLYVPAQRGKIHPGTHNAHWCLRCNARNKIDYRILRKRDGSPKIKVFKFSSNEIEFVRRFKVIAWC